MGKFNRGTKRSQKLAPKGIPSRATNDVSANVSTRVGKQSKFGALKAKAPGARWNVPRQLGG